MTAADAAVGRGAWARVTIDRFRNLAHQTFYGHRATHNRHTILNVGEALRLRRGPRQEPFIDATSDEIAKWGSTAGDNSHGRVCH